MEPIRGPIASPPVPVRAYGESPDADALAPDLAALDLVYRTGARTDLTEDQRRDLQALEQDLHRLRDLGPDLETAQRLAGSHEEFAPTARALAAETAEIEDRVAQKVDLFPPDRDAGLGVLDTGQGLIADFRWMAEPGDALRQHGVEAVEYRMRSFLDYPDYEVTAEPLKGGRPTGHFLSVRVAAPGESERWWGEEMTLGRPGDEGYSSTEFVPTSMGDLELSGAQDGPSLGRWTAMDRALAAKVLNDLGVGWVIEG